MTNFRHQQGVTLLEILIAVVILSLGLLGLAGLQTNSLRNNQSALQRSQAVIESYAIIDAMRVDRVNAIGGAFNLAFEADAPSGDSFADKTLADWRSRLTELFGDTANGSVACNGSLCTITVQWDDSRASGGESNARIVTQAQL